MTLSGPTPPAMPPAPSGDYFDATQWAVLLAIFDAVIPSVTSASAAINGCTNQHVIDDARLQALTAQVQASMAEPPSADLFKTYLLNRPSTDPVFMDAVRRTLSTVPEPARKQLGSALSALASGPGSLLLTGSLVPLQQRSLSEREAILQRWSTSWFGTLRVLFKTFTTIAKLIWLQTSPTFAQAAGFPTVPSNWEPGKPAFDFKFLQFPPSSVEGAVEEIETDVVIVGSGCGGGVAAKVLADAGHRVLVVDKGYYFPPEQLPMSQEAGTYHMFENHGLMSSTDGSINAVAGSCWGGGGSVNWSVSLQTQGFVRREWAKVHGLPFFETAAFQASLDRVCAFMGVIEGDKVRQTHRGAVLLEGSRRLGWPASACPQNTGGAEHWCGHCHLGCGSGEKQGPATSWLPAAAGKGAKFIEGFAADEILWDGTSSREKRAVGVRGTWTSRDAAGSVSGPDAERTTRKIVIRAKRVIVSAGTLNSPMILMRSGLKNPHIGRNLHMHPVNFFLAHYEEDTRPWEGGIITSVCTNFEDLDGHGHGSKLEATCMLPYAIMPHYPWRSGLDFKLAALRLRHTAGYIALARDRDTGRVFPDPQSGKPQIEYRISPFDSAHNLEGLIGLSKICYVTGATEIQPLLPGLEPFKRPSPTAAAGGGRGTDEDANADPSITDPAFVAWIAKLKAIGNSPPYATFTSAHQMGTCRMSSHAGAGVVDSKGRVWGTQGLYVADASVFPSASGVNPMVTVMAIADSIARGVVKELKGGL